MKTFYFIKVVNLLCFTTLLVACYESDYLQVEQEYIDSQNVNEQIESESSFVSLNEAVKVADVFLNRPVTSTTSTRSSQCKKADGNPSRILDENGTTLMYVINYQDGGFVITGTTKNYYPILAYSNEGSFSLDKDMGGAAMWLDKTKNLVRNSERLCDSIKQKMHTLWNSYKPFDISSIELDSRASSSTPEAIQACWNRCYELEEQYASEGWLFAPLLYAESVFSGAGYMNTYNDLCFSADFNNSPLDCSVIGWKLGSIREQVGPLLKTAWHQESPFNDLCNGHPAGCAPVAMAQLMYYYQYPQTLSLNGYTFSWSTIPLKQSPGSDQAKLLKLVGMALGTNYGLVGSWTRPSTFCDGVRSLLYTVTQKDYTPSETSVYLLDHKKPIIMLANGTNLSWIPGHGDLEYIGESHYWVCDGVQQSSPNELQYFTEWQPNGNGTFVRGWNTIENPGVLRGAVYDYFSMNWGNGRPSGWFTDTDNIEFEHSWVNFFIEK